MISKYQWKVNAKKIVYDTQWQISSHCTVQGAPKTRHNPWFFRVRRESAANSDEFTWIRGGVHLILFLVNFTGLHWTPLNSAANSREYTWIYLEFSVQVHRFSSSPSELVHHGELKQTGVHPADFSFEIFGELKSTRWTVRWTSPPGELYWWTSSYEFTCIRGGVHVNMLVRQVNFVGELVHRVNCIGKVVRRVNCSLHLFTCIRGGVHLNMTRPWSPPDAYSQLRRVINIERGSFTFLVFST